MNPKGLIAIRGPKLTSLSPAEPVVPSLARIAPKEVRQRSLLDLSLGNAQHDLLESAFARLRDIEAVQAQEDKRSSGTSALVPIQG